MVGIRVNELPFLLGSFVSPYFFRGELRFFLFCFREGFLRDHSVFKVIHPRKLTWNPKMEVWKMIFPLKPVIFRFQPLVFGGVLLMVFRNPADVPPVEVEGLDRKTLTLRRVLIQTSSQ